MAKKMIELLSSIPAVIVGGAFLVLSFALSHFEISAPVDPAWITVFINGIPLLYSALRKLVLNRGISKISSALLITVAMIAAIAIGDLFAAGEVAFIMAIGEILEELTTDRAKKGLKNLISLAPTRGRKVIDGKNVEISAEDIEIGDILCVLPGEAIPVDGVIVSGETTVDQSVMTGESLPVDKTVGDDVFCGTINRFGAVNIKATRVGEDSSLQKLIHMVQQAENKKAPTARIADKAASWLVPAALLVAVITYFATKDIVRAVTVLVVFCPCALVLATPTAIMAAIGQATKRGVIIKSGEALEKMGKADIVAFDKTGTLTKGELKVCDVICEGIGEDELLMLAASAEMKSEHPLGKAVVAFAEERGLSLTEPLDFKMAAGRGVSAKIDGKSVFCGSESYLYDNGIGISGGIKGALEKLRLDGKAAVVVACDKQSIGVVALSDVLRKEAADAVAGLHKMKTQTVLLTGDNAAAAEHFAKQAGISAVHGELLPEQKVERIEQLQRESKTVCMIGDGVNDAPALKSADVGVAMGSMGSDIAAQAADIALMGDDLSNVPYLKRLSAATVNTIKISITLSMVINILAVILSVMGVLGPTTGALVHNAGSCFVVLFAALLYDRKF